jgi:hypothetical protein
LFGVQARVFADPTAPRFQTLRGKFWLIIPVTARLDLTGILLSQDAKIIPLSLARASTMLSDLNLAQQPNANVSLISLGIA